MTGNEQKERVHEGGSAVAGAGRGEVVSSVDSQAASYTTKPAGWQAS